VSVAGLGCGGKSRLGQSQGMSREHSIGVVRAAIDAGVNFIDTAAAYGTEEIVGEAVKGRRDEVVISTKVMMTRSGKLSDADLVDGTELTRRVEAGLARLGMDYIDILHIHAVDAVSYPRCRDEFYPALERLREAGKIRFTGLTERFAFDTTHEMAEIALSDGLFDVLMLGLNFVNQTAIHKILPATQEKGIGTLCMFAVRGPLARQETARALVEKLIGTGEVDPASVDRDDPLGFLTAPGVASSLTEAAYRYCRHTPGIDVTMTGTGNVDHLLQNLASINAGPLPGAVLDRLTAIFGKVTSESGEP